MIQKPKKPILLLTYFSGIDGCCPAEWADDKIDSLGKLNEQVILISAICSRPDPNKFVVQYRVPSLSPADLRTEWNELKSTRQRCPYSFFWILPFALTLGFLLDLVQKIATNGLGGGKWSWFFSAVVVTLYASIRHNCRLIFTTGGPASAHLAGVVAGFLLRRPIVSELQDPLSGADIGRNSKSAMMLAKVEAIIIKLASKVVYVTKQAAEEAQATSGANNITWIYPGAKRFTEVEEESTSTDKKLRIVHLGTLYSTRNFYTLIEAIDRLISEGQLTENQIEVANLGEIYGEIKEHHLAKSYIKQFPIKPRREALIDAKHYSVSLLVQHADDRSKLTIPYKTYDYLNLHHPILALTHNQELYDLLKNQGHFPVNVSDVDGIADVIMTMVENNLSGNQRLTNSTLDAAKQCRMLLELKPNASS